MSRVGVFVAVLLLVVAGCAEVAPDAGPTEAHTTVDAISPSPLPSTSSPSSTPASAPEPTPTTVRTQTPVRTPPPSPTATPLQDPCGNALGNGDEIVDGPGSPEETGDNDNPFRSLTVHPTEPDTVLLGTERNGILRSTDGGKTWTRFRYGLRHEGEGYPEIYDLAYAVSDPSVVYAATTLGGPGPLVGDYPSAGGGVYRSEDGGERWERRNCGIQDNGGRTTSVWVDPADPSYAVITVATGTVTFGGDEGVSEGDRIPGGIYTTSDGGQQWQAASGPASLNRTDYVNLVGASGTLYTSAWVGSSDSDTGVVFRSTDRGATWTQLSLPVEGTPGVVSAQGAVVHAIVESPTGRYLVRSEDRGETWTAHELRSSGYAVTTMPGNPDTVLYATAYQVHRSTDGLGSSRSVLDLPTWTRPADIAFAPTDPDRVYLVTQGYLFYRSDDAGRSWELLGNLREDVLNGGSP